jgi:ABC-type Mn2+/Zn2+ transport system permease subunit
VAIVVGVALAFVLAQIIDGRVAWFTGLAVTLGIGSWRSGLRRVDEYLGIAVAALIGLGVFFALIQLDWLNGWIALIAGSALAVGLSSVWTSSRRMLQMEHDIINRKV